MSKKMDGCGVEGDSGSAWAGKVVRKTTRVAVVWMLSKKMVGGGKAAWSGKAAVGGSAGKVGEVAQHVGEHRRALAGS